jgi:hypothetical protein
LEFDAMFRVLRALFITQVATEDELDEWTQRLRARVRHEQPEPGGHG